MPLYLVATPIGNLGDITYRAVETLNTVEAILCEDTRKSRILLQHYQIQKPLWAYHDHNEAAKTPALIEKLQAGASYALISDAGMPLVADPGYRLVMACHQAGIPMTVLPGASATLTALALSGLPPLPFLFLGFAPNKESALRTTLHRVENSPATLIFFESPHRLTATLEIAASVLGNRQAAVARELTKKFEEVRRASLPDLANYYTQHPVKGEIVLVIEGNHQPAPLENWQELLAEALKHKSVKEAVQEVSSLCQVSKNVVYAEALRQTR